MLHLGTSVKKSQNTEVGMANFGSAVEQQALKMMSRHFM